MPFYLRAGEMALWLRKLAAHPKDQGPTPSTHVTPHNCQQYQFQGIQYFHTDTHAGKKPKKLSEPKKKVLKLFCVLFFQFAICSFFFFF